MKLGNGGSWCRFTGSANLLAKKYILVTAKKTKKGLVIRYSFDIPLTEKNILKNELHTFSFPRLNRIQYLKLHGFAPESYLTYDIRNDIKEYYKDKPCVSCGSNHDIECDHKNGLYNDPRVLNKNTQNLSDFQPLCSHCNKQKRETINYSKKHHKRYGATKIPHLKPFGIDFTSGNQWFTPDDINAMVGTYWYDPVEFMELSSCLISNNPLLPL